MLIIVTLTCSQAAYFVPSSVLKLSHICLLCLLLYYENSMLFSQSRLELSIVVEVLASMGSNDINIWSKVDSKSLPVWGLEPRPVTTRSVLSLPWTDNTPCLPLQVWVRGTTQATYSQPFQFFGVLNAHIFLRLVNGCDHSSITLVT